MDRCGQTDSPLLKLAWIAEKVTAPWGSRIGRFTVIDAAQQVALLHQQANMFPRPSQCSSFLPGQPSPS